MVTSSAPFAVEVFFDGDCPLCVREIQLLRRLDRNAAIRFTNIAAPDFDAGSVGLSFAQLMRRIHGRMPNGELIEGVEVFRQLYGAVGFRRLVSLTRLPGIKHLLDGAYTLFAKNRLRFTGRCTPELCAAPSRTSSN